MKLAHLADLHLGFRQFDRRTPRGGNQREADVADAFRRAIDDLIVQRPDLILLAGDIFHSIRPPNPAILFLFHQLQRLRRALPAAPVVMLAGEHDTPRSLEAGSILRLYEALDVEVVTDEARRLSFPALDCALLAVPHAALSGGERPALRPQAGVRFNVLALHGEVPDLGEARGTIEYGGALLDRHDIGAPQWDYVALGHYHSARPVETNAWYAGSLEYLPPNPWGQLEMEGETGQRGKGYLLVELPGARIEFRRIAPARQHLALGPLEGRGLTAKELSARIAATVAAARPPIDDQVVRLVVFDVPRATAREIDHAAIRAFKARALHFELELRRPSEDRVVAPLTAGRRQTIPEVVRAFLERRPLDADLDRAALVALGVDYVERAGREEPS